MIYSSNRTRPNTIAIVFGLNGLYVIERPFDYPTSWDRTEDSCLNGIRTLTVDYVTLIWSFLSLCRTICPVQWNAEIWTRSDFGQTKVVRYQFTSNIQNIRNLNDFVQISDVWLIDHACSNVQISDISDILYYECQNPNKIVVWTIVGMPEIRLFDNRTIDRLAFGILLISDVRISAFCCILCSGIKKRLSFCTFPM